MGDVDPKTTAIGAIYCRYPRSWSSHPSMFIEAVMCRVGSVAFTYNVIPLR